jgi:hypothetical protein
MIWTSKAQKLLKIRRGQKPYVCLDEVTPFTRVDREEGYRRAWEFFESP